MLSVKQRVPFFESLVLLDLVLNPGLKDIGEHSNHYANRCLYLFLFKEF